MKKIYDRIWVRTSGEPSWDLQFMPPVINKARLTDDCVEYVRADLYDELKQYIPFLWAHGIRFGDGE